MLGNSGWRRDEQRAAQAKAHEERTSAKQRAGLETSRCPPSNSKDGGLSHLDYRWPTRCGKQLFPTHNRDKKKRLAKKRERIGRPWKSWKQLIYAPRPHDLIDLVAE